MLTVILKQSRRTKQTMEETWILIQNQFLKKSIVFFCYNSKIYNVSKKFGLVYPNITNRYTKYFLFYRYNYLGNTISLEIYIIRPSEPFSYKSIYHYTLL